MKNDEIKNFIQHNQKVFHESQPAMVGQPVVLLEMNALHSAHIAYSYFANAMASASNARLVAYDPDLCIRLRDRFFGNKRRLQTEN